MSRIWSAISLLAAVAVCGCQFDGAGLLRKHFGQGRRAEARRQWDGVRGGIELQLAQNHFAAGRFDEAEKVLEQAMLLTPGDARVQILATKLHLERGDLAKARDAVGRAAATGSGDPEVSYLAGVVAERYGDLEMALEYYATAAAQAPQAAAYLLAHAETLVALDKPIEALELVESRLDDFDGNAPMRVLAAHLTQRLGLRGPAGDYAREALRIQQDDPILVAEVGGILVWAGQYEEAIGLLRPIVEAGLSGQSGPALQPDPAGPLAASVLHDLARAYLATRQWQEAQWTLKLIMTHDQGDAGAWCLYAQAALMLGDLDAAEEALTVLHANAPPTPESLLLAAHVAMRRGAAGETIEAAGKAVEMAPGLVAAHCLMGQAYQVLGREEEACRCYATALSLDPASPIARALWNSRRWPAALTAPGEGPRTNGAGTAAKGPVTAGLGRIEEP
jgi:tetratricopeptide (TPR) repeat protein